MFTGCLIRQSFFFTVTRPIPTSLISNPSKNDLINPFNNKKYSSPDHWRILLRAYLYLEAGADKSYVCPKPHLVRDHGIGTLTMLKIYASHVLDWASCLEAASQHTAP